MIISYYLRSTPIFVRILLASLIPVVLIFSILLLTASNTIFESKTGSAKEATVASIDYTVKMINMKFATLSSRLAVVGENMLEIDRSTDNAEESATNMLLSLLESDDDIYCVRFVFHPGVFGPDMFIKDYINRGGKGEIIELTNINIEQLSKPEQFPWYSNPIKTGKPYIDSTNQYDFGIGEGTVYMCTHAYPIMEDGKIIGVIAADILYSTMYKALDSMQEKGMQNAFMVSDKGEVIHPQDRKYYGKPITNFLTDDKGEFVEAIQNHGTVIKEIHSPFIGEKALVYLAPLEIENTSDLPFVYIERPTSSLYAEAYAAATIIVSMGAIGLILLIFSIFFTSRNIAEPIKKITENANKIANGRRDVEITENLEENLKAKNEIVDLEHSLIKMLGGLSKTYDLELEAIEAKHEKEKAEASVKIKNKYFAMMSHEMRTPLNAILGMSELLISGGLGDIQNKYAHNIKSSSEDLLSIINSILDMSKIEDESFSINPINYDFIAMINNLNIVVSFLATQKGLAYDIDIADGIPRCLYGDDVRLRQVLINITGNAVKYTKKGSIRLCITSEADTLRFDVSDTGEGIKAENLPYIFDPFLSVETADNRYVESTGLGLSLSKKLVEIMGGTISVSSVYGSGSMFSVVIPKIAGDESQMAKPEEIQEKLYAPSMKVLAVDDSEVNLIVIEGLLELYRVNCDKAYSGAQAIEMIQKNDYDIVFMDHMMPDMDGVETAKNIRALGGKYEKLVIVALTANASGASKQMLLDSGMNDFLSKPIEKHKLNHILAKWSPEDKLAEERDVWGMNKKGGYILEEKFSPLLTRVAKIPGIDVDLAVEQMAGKYKIYEKALLLFKDDLPGHIAYIRQLMGEGERNNLMTQMHGIKSVLASMGATELRQKALALETALREKDEEYLKANIDGFCRQLEELGAQLNDAADEPEIAG